MNDYYFSVIYIVVPPKAAIEPETASFVIGDLKELVCHSKGFPEPTINWLRRGQLMVPNENVRVSGNVLTLMNMQRGQEGQYECRASNPAGEYTDTAQLNYIGKYTKEMYRRTWL